MVYFSLDYLTRHYKCRDHSEVFKQKLIDCNDDIVGMVSVDRSMWLPFQTTDDQIWYVFKVNRRFNDDRHPYELQLFGYDDGYCYKCLESLDQFYQWINTYKLRDFTFDDVKSHIDEIV